MLSLFTKYAPVYVEAHLNSRTGIQYQIVGFLVFLLESVSN